MHNVVWDLNLINSKAVLLIFVPAMPALHQADKGQNVSVPPVPFLMKNTVLTAYYDFIRIYYTKMSW